jgi:geranylgeranyl pyrophosphate synthase
MFSSNVDHELSKIAAAAEFIHAASLLHDDIVDEADRRRGKTSVNRAFGNATAVLAGDFLLTEAFDLLQPFDRALSNQAIAVIRQMTKAAILELSTRGKIGVNRETWYTIAKGKTGVLFSWCGYAVARYAQKIDMTTRLSEIGERVGLIFQLVDDLKDFHGDMDLKDVCRDLRNLEPSMPMILAMDLDANVKKRIEQAFGRGLIDEEEALKLRGLIIESGAILQVKRLISEELLKLIDLLAVFKKTLGKAHLDRFIEQLALSP